jgi:hypothetical protein
MEYNPTDQLDIVVTFTQCPSRCLTHHGKGFWKNLVERFSSANPVLELSRFGPQLIITQRPNMVFEGTHSLHQRVNSFQFPFVLAAHNFLNQMTDHKSPARVHSPMEEWSNTKMALWSIGMVGQQRME